MSTQGRGGNATSFGGVLARSCRRCQRPFQPFRRRTSTIFRDALPGNPPPTGHRAARAASSRHHGPRTSWRLPRASSAQCNGGHAAAKNGGEGVEACPDTRDPVASGRSNHRGTAEEPGLLTCRAGQLLVCVGAGRVQVSADACYAAEGAAVERDCTALTVVVADGVEAVLLPVPAYVPAQRISDARDMIAIESHTGHKIPGSERRASVRFRSPGSAEQNVRIMPSRPVMNAQISAP